MKVRIGMIWLAMVVILGGLRAQQPAAATGSDFIIEDPPITTILIATPFKVRAVQGTVMVPVVNEPLSGAIFQLRDRPGHVRFVTTNEKGEFTLPDVAPGTYDFKVTKNEFHSVIGKVIVSRRRFRKGKIRISLPIGT